MSKKTGNLMTLKKITHREIHQLLTNGDLEKIGIEKRESIISSKVKVCREYSNDPNVGIFINDLQRKNDIVFCSTNQREFDYFLIGNKKEERGEKMCDWCRKLFRHKNVGITVAYSEILHDGKPKRLFWIYGCHCRFECALAEIQEEKKKISRENSYDLISAESLLRFLYYLTTEIDGTHLKPTCHWRLLLRNGGSMNDEDADKCIFYETGSVYLLPVKLFYEKYEVS